MKVLTDKEIEYYDYCFETYDWMLESNLTMIDRVSTLGAGLEVVNPCDENSNAISTVLLKLNNLQIKAQGWKEELKTILETTTDYYIRKKNLSDS